MKKSVIFIIIIALTVLTTFVESVIRASAKNGYRESSLFPHADYKTTDDVGAGTIFNPNTGKYKPHNVDVATRTSQSVRPIPLQHKESLPLGIKNFID